MSESGAQEMGPDAPVIHRGCFVCGEALASDFHVRDCVQKLKIKLRGYQIMARQMLQMIGIEAWHSMVENNQYERAGGDVECDLCRQLYYDHPQLPGLASFHLTCRGKIVKL